MAEHLGVIDKAVDEYLTDHGHPERLVRPLREAEREWLQTFAARVVGAIQHHARDP